MVTIRSLGLLTMAFALACASERHTGSFSVKPCPDSAQLPPKAECSKSEAFGHYQLELAKLVISSLPLLHNGESAAFQLIYSEGPRVDFVCYGPMSDNFSEDGAQRVARGLRVRRPPSPDLNSCLAGHRVIVGYNLPGG